MIENEIAYRALKSHDARFDGIFFVGVLSTGIYCRPVCPAKTPQLKNCRFFESAEAAEKARFRPCLRCRPELAPGHAPVDQGQRIAHLMARRIEEGWLDERKGLEEVAAHFQLSSRQLRRIVQKELGVSPVDLMQTRRLLLAKQLLTETTLPVTDVAYSSGFASLRRFNDAFSRQYKMSPTRLRKQLAQPSAGKEHPTSQLLLSYRPPYDWECVLDFLKARGIRGVEWVTEESYARTVRLGKYTGWLQVRHVPEKHSLRVEFAHTLSPVLPALLGRLRNLFDLNARPDLIASHLIKDKRLRNSLSKHPGRRVPGAFDGFELAVRAILGQQITVSAATTIAGRVAEAFGDRIETPFPELSLLSPLASRIARSDSGTIARQGIVSARAAGIVALACAYEAGVIKLEPGTDPEAEIERLIALAGIGQWTAQYISMRALRWPDAFPKEDIAIRKALGGVSAKEAEVISQAWRPWRSYAVMHLWSNSKAMTRSGARES